MPNLPSQIIPDMLDWRQTGDRAGQGRVVTVWIQSYNTLDGIEAFTSGSPHTNTIVITDEIESGFVAKTTWFHSSAVLISSNAAPLQKEESMGGVKGSTHNGHSDPKCPSARRIRMVRIDPGAPSEGATCAWMEADKAVGCMRVFLTMWRSSQ
ncbi:uncharacterized protein TNCV_3884181 [Trichonephila clavipes]|nr:uncharacterized protein TNCV_3884181 [Trichonephila clavipes]